MVYHEKKQLFAVGYESGTIEIWDVSKGALMHSLKAHAERAGWLTFTSDGNALLSSADYLGERKLWKMPTAELLHTLPSIAGPTTVLPDAAFIALADTNGLQIYDLRTQRLLPEKYRTNGVVRSVTSRVGGKYLAVGTSSGFIQLWKFSIASGKPNLNLVKTIQPYAPGNWIMGVHFSKGSDSLLTVSRSGILDRWSIPDLTNIRSEKSTLRAHFKMELHGFV